MSLRAGSMVLVRRNDGEEKAPTPALPASREGVTPTPNELKTMGSSSYVEKNTPTPTLPTREEPGIPNRHLQAGAYGEEKTPTPALPTREVPGTGVHGEGVGFPPYTGGQGLPVLQGLKGGRNTDSSFPSVDTYIPIEQLKPNDCVIGLDGQPHPIIDIIKTPYQGGMAGIQHKASPHTLWITPDQKVLCLQRPRIPDGKNDWSADPKINAKWRKALRNNQTPAEQKLWSLLRRKQLGVKFRRQHSIGPYIADFYSSEARLVIDCDGPNYHKYNAQNYDFRRERYMNERGLCVLHFNNNDIFNNFIAVYELIMNSIRFDMTDLEKAIPVRAEELKIGDKVFSGKEMKAAVLDKLIHEQVNEVVYALEVEGTNSYFTEVCLVHE